MRCSKIFGFFSVLIIALLIVSSNTACRPNSTDEDFGTVVSEIPEVPGADKPYVVKGLAPPDEQKSESTLEINEKKPENEADPTSDPISQPNVESD